MSGEHVTTWTKTYRRPRFTVYRPSDRSPRVMLNKYGAVNGHGGVTIGLCVILFGRAWSLVWARPVSHVEQVDDCGTEGGAE